MKLGIMQPYLFPYLGYWQHIYAVDKYVVLDDVNYIMRGYINRNTIMIGGKEYRFSIPIKKPSQNKLIMDTKLNFTDERKKDFLKTLEMAYKKAPFFQKIYELIECIIMNHEDDLTEYIIYSIKEICKYLSIETPIQKSSQIKKNDLLRGEERIIEICKALDADTYINPSGGRKLYSHERFKREQINLLFLDPDMDSIQYNQFGNEFINYLSIIDVMMFNDVFQIRGFLEKYNLNEE